MIESDFVKFDRKDYVPKHELSSFFGSQLLADYALGNLDPIRARLIEEKLRDDDNLATSLRALRHSINYCKSLGNIQLSNDVFVEIQEPNELVPRWGKWLNWKKWPTSFRWSSEALAISIFVAIVASLIPWKRFLYQFTLDQKWTIVEVKRDSPRGLKTEIDLADAVAAGGQRAAIPKGDEELTPEVPEPTNEPPAPSGKTSASPNVTGVDQVSVKPNTSEQLPTPQKGFVYRANIKLKNLDSVSPKIVSLIENLGGIKAGEVRLGWRKPDGSYFHFLIEEIRYEELKKQLLQYAPVNFTKDEHPRVIESGKMRIILWIEEIIEPTIEPTVAKPENNQNPRSESEVKPEKSPAPAAEPPPQ